VSTSSLSALVRVPDAAALEYERGRLAMSIPLSTHRLLERTRFARASRRVVGAVALFLLTIGSLALTVEMLKKQHLPSAVFGACLAFGFFYWGARLISAASGLYHNAIEEVVLCHDGLRWHKDKTEHMAVWSEIASVDAFEFAQKSHQGLQGWYARITLKLRSGETLVLDSELLSDFVNLGNTIKARHAETLQSSSSPKNTAVADALAASAAQGTESLPRLRRSTAIG
jgi:hypothetical protein